MPSNLKTNFLTRHPLMAVFLFTFIAPMISKFDVHDLRIDNALMFTKPNSEYWFGTDNLGRDYWSQV